MSAILASKRDPANPRAIETRYAGRRSLLLAMTKPLLLLGKQGQLGSALAARLAAGDRPLVALGRADLDLTQPAAIASVVSTLRPAAIVNCAAYTAVDRAEQEPELAEAINGRTPGLLAEAANQVGARLLHISTDYVFDGRQGRPYCESDRPQPLNVYGRSKLAGEQAVQAAGDRHAILRVGWLYSSRDRGNFATTMLRLGRERAEVRVVADQVGGPTEVGDVAEAIAQLPEDFSGLYHYSSSGVASWYDFAVAIFEEAQALEIPLQVKRVVPITTAEYLTAAQRPSYSVLDHQAIARLLGTPPPHWRASLRRMLRAWRDRALRAPASL